MIFNIRTIVFYTKEQVQFFERFKKKTNKQGICLSHNPLQILL